VTWGPAAAASIIAPVGTGDVTTSVDRDSVATVEMHRPPDNYFDIDLITSLADAYADLDGDPSCRAIVLCSEGKNFCAGADFAGASGAGSVSSGPEGVGRLYQQAARLLDGLTPVVAAVQGAAVGGGLGLACTADFRVGCPEARFAANFARLGFHHGFGLTVTLPAIVGRQNAQELLLTGRRMAGEEAARMGLCDRMVERGEVRTAAHGLAAEIAASAPLAVRSIRQTMRAGLADSFRGATAREQEEQDRLRLTEDFAEGVRAASERRPPRFSGS
jgi:2-(1,2-epoxy-1,2-dihydrophenyl)acetyl-CoA isomerase